MVRPTVVINAVKSNKMNPAENPERNIEKLKMVRKSVENPKAAAEKDSLKKNKKTWVMHL